MSNPRKKFEIEIAPVGVWFTELDEHGKRINRSRYFNNTDLERDIFLLLEQLQIDFNF
ncbi:hypothetical protein LCGC14_2954230 [marine sediment metagenome]|uniref:Uncharacterized protein n=1 Tax=marine sediment metagenome TaxID=412755 RepID=A0A0F8XEZ8_9ZZZZ